MGYAEGDTAESNNSNYIKIRYILGYNTGIIANINSVQISLVTKLTKYREINRNLYVQHYCISIHSRGVGSRQPSSAQYDIL